MCPRIKKAYRKKALELHPDRNFGDVENATAKFAEVQSAYEILSDPQERVWYDSHRDTILRGDDDGPEETHFHHNVRLTSSWEVMRMVARVSSGVPFTDNSKGFYSILRQFFEMLATEEDASCDWENLQSTEYPNFGSAESDYETVVKPFYRAWIAFSTQKTFAWRDAFNPAEAPDRYTRRVVERENKKHREEGIRDFNDAVRHLVIFVRKRDPRFIPNTQTDADRQKILRDAAAAQAARARAANQAKLNQHVTPNWAQGQSTDEDASLSSEHEQSPIEHVECVACGKTFKSEKQYEAHEKSRKHVKRVAHLQREMLKENKRLNLNEPSDSSAATSYEEGGVTPIEQLKDLDLESTTEAEHDEGTLPSNGNRTDNDAQPDYFISGIQNNLHGRAEQLQEDAHSHPASSDLSSPDDEYAPREAVESRLVGSLSSARSEAENGIGGMALTTVTASASVSDEDGVPQPKIGKAKVKRAKRVARQEAAAQGSHHVS